MDDGGLAYKNFDSSEAESFSDDEDWEQVGQNVEVTVDQSPMATVKPEFPLEFEIQVARVLEPKLTFEEKAKIKWLLLHVSQCTRVTSLVFASLCHSDCHRAIVQAQCVSLLPYDYRNSVQQLKTTFLEMVAAIQHSLLVSNEGRPEDIVREIRDLASARDGASPFQRFLERLGTASWSACSKFYLNLGCGGRKRQKLSKEQIFDTVQSRWVAALDAAPLEGKEVAQGQLSCWIVMLYYVLMQVSGIPCRLVASLKPLSLHCLPNLARKLGSLHSIVEHLQRRHRFPCVLWVEMECSGSYVCVDPSANSAKWTQALPYKMDKNTQETATCYVFSFSKPRCFLDCTKKYAKDWHKSAQRNRQCTNKFRQSWNRLVGFHEARDPSFEQEKQRFEDDWLKRLTSVPQTVKELHGHPCFVLERHIKHNQVIYPSSTRPVGYYDGKEKIFSRQNLHTLHSRFVWLSKRGLHVDPKELPALLVKSKAKKSRDAVAAPNKLVGATGVEAEALEFLCNDVPEDELLKLADVSKMSFLSASDLRLQLRQGSLSCLFGFWQTTPYVAPSWSDICSQPLSTVSIFNRRMIPKDASHLPDTPKSAELARKMGLRYKKAIVGFEYRRDRAHPIVRGIVLSQQDAILLTEASSHYGAHLLQEQQQKRNLKFRSLWIKMTRHLQRREVLKAKYL